MTAKEYLTKYQKTMYCFDEINLIIDDLYEMRPNKGMIENYYERILRSDERYEEWENEYKKWSDALAEYGQKEFQLIDGSIEYIDNGFKLNDGEFSIYDAENIRVELLRVIQEDKSFGHLFNLLSKDKDNFITQQEIEKAILEEEKTEKLTRKTFFDYLIADNVEIKNAIIEKLKEILRGKKGKQVAKVLCAMKEAGVIAYSDGERKSLYASMKVIFGNIGSDESINKLLRADWKNNENHKEGLIRSDVEPYVNLFKKIAVT